MEFANMSGLDALDEIFDTADARAVGAASEEPVADVDMADVVTAHGDFECALRDRPEEDPALWRLVGGDGHLWRCGSRCRHKNCMQRLAAFHYDWLCTTARKAERLLAATKAQDLVNMDRKHGGGQAKGAKVQTPREKHTPTTSTRRTSASKRWQRPWRHQRSARAPFYLYRLYICT